MAKFTYLESGRCSPVVETVYIVLILPTPIGEFPLSPPPVRILTPEVNY